MAAVRRVAETLRPWLGSAFVARNAETMEVIALRLLGFRPQQDSFAALAFQLDNLLFMQVREDTGGQMTLIMDNEQAVRLRMNDFSLMADELMYLLFEALPKNASNHALIRSYSMKSVSLSALRALYLLYRDMQDQEETATLKRIIIGGHPPFRWKPWIDS
jgi:hypothetical protein